MRIAIAAGACALALAGPAAAEVAEQWDTGFIVRNVVEVQARADRAYQALGEIGRWWSNDHTYSGAAANMTLELKPGACFCEALPGGGVAHGTVVLAWPAQGMLRIDTALGPLQEQGVSGALTFVVRPKGEGVADVVQTYRVGGGKPGLAKDFAAPVDQVIREQVLRFEKYVETGRPE